VTRKLALVALLLLAASAGCGKYGKPVRVSPTPPTVGVGAQPGATAPAAAPAGEECEEEPKETPAP
jgi:hypothetical protein